jgi:hypothetical protein
MVCILAGLALAAATICACGGGGQNNGDIRTGQAGTPAGTYTLNVTAASSVVTHSTSLSLTVQN